MSQVDELLNMMSVDGAESYAAKSSSEEHIVVGTDRYITVPEKLKKIAVQFDHDVETVTFDCPRYWDNHDLSRMSIYINYMRADGYTDSYHADRVRTDGNIMHFDWTISGNVTAVKGTIMFLVCAKTVDAYGNEKDHWHSELNRDMYVSQGLETNKDVEYSYPDIITQLLSKTVLVEKVSNTIIDVERLYRPNNTVSGKLIQVTDIGPAAPASDAKIIVKSHNMVKPCYKTETANGYTVQHNDDGTVVVSGSRDNATSVTISLLCNEQLTELISSKDRPYVVSIYKDGHLLKNVEWRVNEKRRVDGAVGQDVGGSDGLTRLRFGTELIPKLASDESVVYDITSVEVVYNTTYNDASICGVYTVQIEEGENNTAYVPYVDITDGSTNVMCFGSKLFDAGSEPNIVVNKYGDEYASYTNLSLPSGTYTVAIDYKAYYAIDAHPLKLIVKSSENDQSMSDGYSSIASGDVVTASTNTYVSGYVYKTFIIPAGEFGVSARIYTQHTEGSVELSNFAVYVGDKFEDYRDDESVSEVLRPEALGDGVYGGYTRHIAPIMTVVSNKPGVDLEMTYYTCSLANIINDLNRRIDEITGENGSGDEEDTRPTTTVFFENTYRSGEPNTDYSGNDHSAIGSSYLLVFAAVADDNNTYAGKEIAKIEFSFDFGETWVDVKDFISDSPTAPMIVQIAKSATRIISTCRLVCFGSVYYPVGIDGCYHLSEIMNGNHYGFRVTYYTD